MPTLQFHLPDTSTTTFELPNTERLSIGAALDNDLQVADPSISRAHAELSIKGSEYRIKDLGSTNKTWINNVAIVELPLKDNTNIRLGHVEGRFLNNEPANADGSHRAAPDTLPPLAILTLKNASGGKKPVTHRFRTTRLTVGWKSHNLIQLRDPSVSGQHAEITYGNGVYRVKDLDSSNHTFLNGSPITEAELHPGDLLSFGAVEAIFTLGAAPAEAKAPASPTAATVAAPIAPSAPSVPKVPGAPIAKAVNPKLTASLTPLSTAPTAPPPAFNPAETAKVSLDPQREKAQQAEIERLSQALKQLQQQLEEQKTESAAKLAESATKLAESAGKLKETATKLAQAENATTAAEAKAAKAETQAKEHFEVLLQKESALTDALAEAAKGAEASEAQLAQLALQTNAVSNSEKERQAAAETIAQLTKELAEAKAAPAADSSRDELEKARQEIATLTKQRETADIEAATLAAKLDDEHQQTEAIATANTQLQNECDTLSTRLKDFERRLQALTQERDTAEQNVIELEHQFAALLSETKEAPTAAKSSSERPAPVKKSPPAPVLQKQPSGATIKLESSPATLKSLIEEAPQALSSMRKLLHTFIKNQRETSLLDQLLASLQGLTIHADKAQLAGAVTMTRAIEALVRELTESPSQITSSSLRSISQSLDFLGTLFEEKNITRIQGPLNANIFAVDDDADARKIIRAAMEVIQLKVTCANDPQTTLAALDEQVFDLIFVDVGLPEMNGFELCTKIRSLPQHRKTPVVFLTGAVTVQNRVQSSLSGGNDFIAKPFNILELGVKALTWILKGQLGLQ